MQLVITKEVAIKEARECGASDVPETDVPALVVSREELHAYANRMCQLGAASAEAEVVRLRDALGYAMTICDAVPTKAHVNSTDACLRYLGKLVNQGHGCLGYYAKIRDALSTPPSTSALDEYVAEKVKEELKGNK